MKSIVKNFYKMSSNLHSNEIEVWKPDICSFFCMIHLSGIEHED